MVQQKLLEGNTWYAFGSVQTASPQASFQVSSRFTAQVLNAETGLYYYNARYYDPGLARFIQSDTIIPDLGNPQSYNRYSYVANNPLRYIDPNGHGLLDWIGSLFSYSGPTYLGPEPGAQPRYGPPLAVQYDEIHSYAENLRPNAVATWSSGRSLAFEDSGTIATTFRDQLHVGTELATGAATASLGKLAKAGEIAVSDKALSRFVNTENKLQRAAENASRGFKSFDALKSFLGSPGEGNAWHHIVEQSKLKQFGAKAIHNMDNVVAIPEKLNSDLNALYSSFLREERYHWFLAYCQRMARDEVSTGKLRFRPCCIVLRVRRNLVMNSKDDIENLLLEFAGCVIAQNEAIKRHDPETGNQLARRYMKAADNLISLGEEGINSFATLLNDPRVEVRTMAACDLLPYKTEEALVVLEQSARGTGAAALGAFITLARWKGKEDDLSRLLQEYRKNRK